MGTKVEPQVSEETERAILTVAPEQECLDWICYRVRGGVEPAERTGAPRPPAGGAAAAGARPEREDIARALRRLVTLGMLTFDGRRWSMTSKGYTVI